MNFDQYAQSLGAAAAPPTDNILGASDANLISNYNKGAFLAQASGTQSGARGGEASVQAANARQAEEYARKQQINDLSTKAQQYADSINGKNYIMAPKPDGGFDFKDPLGKPITVSEYARSVGTTPDKVLASSTNALDQQYINDLNTMQSIHGALMTNDNASLNKIGMQVWGDNTKTPEDPVNKAAIQRAIELKKMKPADLGQMFMGYYPHIYGPQSGSQYGVQPVGQGADQVAGAGGLSPYTSGLR